MKPANEIAQEAVLWVLVAIVLVWGLTGCSTLRELTMTKDEVRYYGQLTFLQCLDPDVVCITGKPR
jgi:predicted ferric reductase